MKLAWIAAALLTTIGCEKAPSKLDKVSAEASAGATATSGDLESRVAKLETKLRGVDREALELLIAAHEQRQEQEAKPQPGKIYGVDIQSSLQIGHVEGAPDALVTIVEAWDFA